MSEVHIRINKRFFERVIWVLVIIGIITFFLLTSPSTVDTQQVDSLQSQVDNLTATNEQLTTQLATLQAEVETLEEDLEEANSQPEPEPEPQEEEQQLSGNLDISYDAQVSDGRLNAFIIAVSNGLEFDQTLTARVNWVGGDLSQVVQHGEVFVRSGRNGQIIIDSLPSNPGSNTDSIRVLIRDADDRVVDQQTIRVL